MDPMNDAALEREIERALAVDPSPEFLVRVRERIAEQPSPAPRGFGWLIAGVTAAAVAAGVVALVMLRPDEHVGPESGLLVSRAINSSVVVPALSHRLDRERRTTHVERRTANDAPRTTHLERHVSEPLFDTRETMTLQRLIAAVHDARVDLSPLLKEAPMPVQPIDDLVIAPITIEPLVPGGIEGERP
jgi:hypothetical protein